MAEKKLKREVEYKLEVPISLHKDGEKIFGNNVLLKAPSVAEMRERCIIKQVVMSAIQEQSKDSEGKTQPESNDEDVKVNFGEQIVGLIYMNQSGEKIQAMVDAFLDILKSSATIDGVKISDYLAKEIHCSDLDAMLGVYIENFILPSWMKRTMNI